MMSIFAKFAGPRHLRLVVPILIVFLTAGIASACPTCKDAIAQNDPAQQAMAAGYYYSILFMMSMPFAILGTFGSLAYISIRRAQTAGVGTSTPNDIHDIQ